MRTSARTSTGTAYGTGDVGNCLIEIGGAGEFDTIKRNGNHYIMMHFSKYVERGYERVGCL